MEIYKCQLVKVDESNRTVEKIYPWRVTTPNHKIKLAEGLARQLEENGAIIDERGYMDSPEWDYKFYCLDLILYVVGLGKRPKNLWEEFLQFISRQPNTHKFLSYRAKRALETISKKVKKNGSR